MTSGHHLFFSNININYFFSNKIYITVCESSGLGGYIFYLCATVLVLLQTCLSLGGGVWRSRVEYVCRVVYLWCTVCYCSCHLWCALPYSAAPTVCIRLAGSLPIECCARSHMGSLYSVSELRGCDWIVQTGLSLYLLYINKWPTRGPPHMYIGKHYHTLHRNLHLHSSRSQP